jgi:hypothetical protein
MQIEIYLQIVESSISNVCPVQKTEPKRKVSWFSLVCVSREGLQIDQRQERNQMPVELPYESLGSVLLETLSLHEIDQSRG